MNGTAKAFYEEVMRNFKEDCGITVTIVSLKEDPREARRMKRSFSALSAKARKHSFDPKALNDTALEQWQRFSSSLREKRHGESL